MLIQSPREPDRGLQEQTEKQGSYALQDRLSNHLTSGQCGQVRQNSPPPPKSAQTRWSMSATKCRLNGRPLSSSEIEGFQLLLI
jgi:hypothetical protein